MKRDLDIPFWIMAFAFVMMAWIAYPGNQKPPAPVKIELTPEVRYEIQKQVQREVRKLTKPVLPMVAPNPKVKVKR